MRNLLFFVLVWIPLLAWTSQARSQLVTILDLKAEWVQNSNSPVFSSENAGRASLGAQFTVNSNVNRWAFSVPRFAHVMQLPFLQAYLYYPSLTALRADFALGEGLSFYAPTNDNGSISGTFYLHGTEVENRATITNYDEIINHQTDDPLVVEFDAPSITTVHQSQWQLGVTYVTEVVAEYRNQYRQFSPGDDYEWTVPAFGEGPHEIAIHVTYARTVTSGTVVQRYYYTSTTRTATIPIYPGEVTGRVVDRKTKAALPGATVSSGVKSTVSGSDGTFHLSGVDIAGGALVKIAAAGYVTANRSLIADVNSLSQDLGDVQMVNETDAPVVEWLKPEEAVVYLPEFGMKVKISARVNWNGHDPGLVRFIVNDRLVESQSGEGPEFEVEFSGKDYFLPSTLPKSNKIVAWAESADGVSSEQLINEVSVVSLPEPFLPYIPTGSFDVDSHKIKFKFSYTRDEFLRNLSVPMLGSIGTEFALATEAVYNVTSGEFEVKAGGSYEGTGAGHQTKANVVIGDYKGKFMAELYGKGVWGPGRPFRMNELGGTLAASYRIDGPKWSMIDLLAPASPIIRAGILDYPPVDAITHLLYFQPTIEPKLSGTIAVKVEDEYKLDAFRLEGQLKTTLALNGRMPFTDGYSMKASLIGDPTLALRWPNPNSGNLFDSLKVRLWFELQLVIAGLSFRTPQYQLVEYKYPSNSAQAARVSPAHEQALAGDVDGLAATTWQPMERPWRDRGGEKFQTAAGRSAKRGGAGPVGIASAANESTTLLPLVENTFTYAEPAVATHGDQALLVYVRDSGRDHPLQFTEIAFSHFDGAGWNAPAAVAPVPNAQFSPKVAFDGTGKAVAVWKQIKNPAFEGTVLPNLMAEFEILTATWNPVTGLWSVPVAMTNNGFLDDSPKLAGPLADGDLLMTWSQNESNQLIGTGAAGAATNTRVMTMRWDSATATWSEPEVLVASLTGEESEALAARASQGVYAWTRDTDGNLGTSEDVELYYRLYDATLGTWAPAVRHTNDATQDRNVRVVINSEGQVTMVWRRGEDLVMSVNQQTATEVRANSGAMDFAELVLTSSPSDDLVMLWQRQEGERSEVYARVFDATSNSWGLDTALTDSPSLENAMTAAWDSQGTLIFAFCQHEVLHETRTMTDDNGVEEVVEDVPVQGATSLVVGRKPLIADLSIDLNEGVTVQGETFFPGETVKVHVRVRNSGDLTINNAMITVYDGDPDVDGGFIAAVPLETPLAAAEEREFIVDWMVPEPAMERTLYAVVDRDNEVTEFNEFNNSGRFLVRVDKMEVGYKSGSVARDGSARMVVTVRNAGSTNSVAGPLELWPYDDDAQTALTTVEIPELAPGISMDVPLTLPAGSQDEGSKAYRVYFNDAESFFLMNLHIDDDQDGLPRAWEIAHGLSDDDAEDADADVDGDGMTGRQEYLAGTDPRDRASALQFASFQLSDAVGGGKTATITWKSVENRQYLLERSFDLVNWSPVGAQVRATPPVNSMVDEVTPPDGRVFYRVKAR